MDTYAVPVRSSARLVYIDHIRVFLTVLVMLHHLMVTYAHVGGWDYQEGSPDFVTVAVGGWFCATNQAYFMGLFLFISAYFVPGSYDRKGAGRFLRDRLVRLGIPLAIFSWVIYPMLIYVLYRTEIGTGFWQFYPARYFGTGVIIGHGPLWFVELLLIFSLLYVAWRTLFGERMPPLRESPTPFPANRTIALFALGLALAAFAVRIPFPMDQYTYKPLNLQFPFFASYIALFVLGLIAYRRRWLEALPDDTGRFWLRVTGGLILVWPPMALALGAAEGSEAFRGGLHWEAMVYALWESGMCVSAVIALLYVFRRWANRPFALSAYLGANAYTAYIIHAPVIIGVAVAMRSLQLYPLLKFAVAVLVSVPLCFVLGDLTGRIPGTGPVLGERAGRRRPPQAGTAARPAHS